jgi:hypothetical protein
MWEVCSVHCARTQTEAKFESEHENRWGPIATVDCNLIDLSMVAVKLKIISYQLKLPHSDLTVRLNIGRFPASIGQRLSTNLSIQTWTVDIQSNGRRVKHILGCKNRRYLCLLRRTVLNVLGTVLICRQYGSYSVLAGYLATFR